jgi:DNA-binding transcriptional regulator YiaG
MQDLTEIVDYQQGKIHARETKLTIKPIVIFNTDYIKRICYKSGSNQVVFGGSLGVSQKTIEALGNCYNKPEEASWRLIELVRDGSGFLGGFRYKYTISSMG